MWMFAGKLGPTWGVLAAAFCAAVGWSGAAQADVVTFGGSCGRSTDVIQWTPQKGPIARYVATQFVNSQQTGIWMALGTTKTAFWTAEGRIPNDACDTCSTLSIVETTFTGKRTRHVVLSEKEHSTIGDNTVALQAYVLKKLWKLAEVKTWPVTQLKQDYTIAKGQVSASAPDKEPPYSAFVKTKAGAEIKYDMPASTEMCWCIFDWRGKVTKQVSLPPAQSAELAKGKAD
ncbi:MAG: hypothetical protein IPK82_31175 [Polyangiaceae bacterium]|nr:hypothetical protein [Polyangiaceae bacterium]